MSQPGTFYQEVAGSSGTMVTQGGTSDTDEQCLAYRLQLHMEEWLNECNTNFALDDTSITAVTGYTEGVYDDVWLLPTFLVANDGDDVNGCLLGPIVATVTIDATGACTGIVPTLKNGQYFAGEELIVQSDRAGMGSGSAPIKVTVLTGTENKPNLSGCPYWKPVGYSWSIPKWWTYSYGRTNAYSDTQWANRMGTSSTSSSGSSTWYNYNMYRHTGWSTTRERAELTGSTDSYSSSVTTTFSDTYVFRFYFNSEPGQETFLFADTSYYKHLGITHHDTSNGYYGSEVIGDWGLMYSSSFVAQQTGVSKSNDITGVFAQDIDAGITRQGYVKPYRTLECNNWMVAGGNSNLVTTYSTSVPTAGTYTNGDGTISYRQISRLVAGRVL